MGAQIQLSQTYKNRISIFITMPQISQRKKDKISEQILHYLFVISPQPNFTNKIANEIARDEEFTKSLLQELEKKNLIVKVNKNPTGKDYIRRERWRLSNDAFEAYKNHQSSQDKNPY